MKHLKKYENTFGLLGFAALMLAFILLAFSGCTTTPKVKTTTQMEIEAKRAAARASRK